MQAVARFSVFPCIAMLSHSLVVFANINLHLFSVAALPRTVDIEH